MTAFFQGDGRNSRSYIRGYVYVNSRSRLLSTFSKPPQQLVWLHALCSVTGRRARIHLLKFIFLFSFILRRVMSNPVFYVVYRERGAYLLLFVGSILQLLNVIFAFAGQYRIIKDLYQDVCVSSDALFEPIH